MPYETVKDLPPLVLAALFLGFLGCNEQEKDVQPGQQDAASENGPQLTHDGNNPCPIPPDAKESTCNEHCGEYKIVLDESYCQDALPVLYRWRDCVGKQPFCVEAHKEWSEAEWVKNHCTCCGDNGTFECAIPYLWKSPFQEKINNGVDVYKEFDGPIYEVSDCGEVTDQVCCDGKGYWVNYDHSANKITIGCQ